MKEDILKTMVKQTHQMLAEVQPSVDERNTVGYINTRSGPLALGVISAFGQLSSAAVCLQGLIGRTIKSVEVCEKEGGIGVIVEVEKSPSQ